MAVRDLEWNDFDGWVDLYYSRYEEIERNPDLGVYFYPARPTRAEEATIFGQLAKGVLEKNAVAVVAEEGGRLIGTCTIVRRGNHREDRHIGVLGVAILPDQRGKGFGDALLASALERCRGLFEIVELKVISVNTPARRLYEKHGFRVYGHQPRAFKRGERYLDDVLMWRPVESGTATALPRGPRL